jgi:hypothetical protein
LALRGHAVLIATRRYWSTSRNRANSRPRIGKMMNEHTIMAPDSQGSRKWPLVNSALAVALAAVELFAFALMYRWWLVLPFAAQSALAIFTLVIPCAFLNVYRTRDVNTYKVTALLMLLVSLALVAIGAMAPGSAVLRANEEQARRAQARRDLRREQIRKADDAAKADEAVGAAMARSAAGGFDAQGRWHSR